MSEIRPPAISRTIRLCGVPILLSLAVIFSSCGGGSGGSNGGGEQPPSATDFSLAANPPSRIHSRGHDNVDDGDSYSSKRDFLRPFPSELTGLPSGVTASPANFQLIPGSPETVELSAAADAPMTSVNAKLTATFGALNHTANLGVAVTAAPPPPPPLSTRTKYIRTDAVTEYYLSVNTHWEVYHSPTSRLFVTDPYSNQVFVFDSTTETSRLQRFLCQAHIR